MSPRSVFLLVFSAILCTACPKDDPPDPDGWRTIFNGENLDGWETIGELGTAVNDGILLINATAPNNNAWVLTEQSYRNFYLECEFRMPDTTANSGVLFRFDQSVDGNPNATAYEANIDWRTNIQNSLGTLEFAARADLIEGLNPNDWVKMNIEADGDHLKVFINEQMVCETYNRRRADGQIGLQVPISQGDQIAFRNIRLKELPDTPSLDPLLEDQYRSSDKPMMPLLNNGSFDGWNLSGPGTWEFEGDILHGNSGPTPSFLISDAIYQDFYLKFEFQIEVEDNSGIFIRKHPDSTQVSLLNSIECNIYDNEAKDLVFSTGSIVQNARAFYGLSDPEGWNEMEIFAKDEHLILFINGKKSAESYISDSFNRPGSICLQAGTRIFLDNGPSDVYFRNMMIRNMDE